MLVLYDIRSTARAKVSYSRLFWTQKRTLSPVLAECKSDTIAWLKRHNRPPKGHNRPGDSVRKIRLSQSAETYYLFCFDVRMLHIYKSFKFGKLLHIAIPPVKLINGRHQHQTSQYPGRVHAGTVEGGGGGGVLKFYFVSLCVFWAQSYMYLLQGPIQLPRFNWRHFVTRPWVHRHLYKHRNQTIVVCSVYKQRLIVGLMCYYF